MTQLAFNRSSTSSRITVAHVVGNSLGGWGGTSSSPRSFRSAHSPCSHRPGCGVRGRLGTPSPASAGRDGWRGTPVGRCRPWRSPEPVDAALVLGQTHGRPIRLSSELARSTIRSLGSCSGFDAVVDATAARHANGFTALAMPVTVAFGLCAPPPAARPSPCRLDQLPAHTRLERLPGCGHIPIADDPSAAAVLIIRSTTRLCPLAHQQANSAAAVRSGADRTTRAGENRWPNGTAGRPPSAAPARRRPVADRRGAAQRRGHGAVPGAVQRRGHGALRRPRPTPVVPRAQPRRLVVDGEPGEPPEPARPTPTSSSAPRCSSRPRHRAGAWCTGG